MKDIHADDVDVSRPTNIQMTQQARALLEMLRKRYGKRSMSAGLVEFIRNHEPDLIEKADQMNSIIREAAHPSEN